MTPKLKRRIAKADKLYKQALEMSGPAERKLLMKAHSNLDQMLSAGRDLDVKLLNRLREKQARVLLS